MNPTKNQDELRCCRMVSSTWSTRDTLTSSTLL